jgi:hypothetical protein
MVVSGRAPPSALISKVSLTPEEISAAETVLAVFPACMVERWERLNKQVSLLERDQHILAELAESKAGGGRAGQHSRGAIAKRYGKTGPWLDELKKIQSSAIAKKLKPFMGNARPMATGRILFDEHAAA